ncbi:MAG TPA: hypothetical protein VMW10_09775, partial [Alphaproteobacteria bacterium]|nr:hypothetical protein [Alphaproteobacteria bacterium]
LMRWLPLPLKGVRERLLNSWMMQSRQVLYSIPNKLEGVWIATAASRPRKDERGTFPTIVFASTLWGRGDPEIRYFQV